ncbi:MAG: hypothetical protein R6U31_03300 [bacterium]
MFLRRQLPLFIAGLMGIGMIIQFFVPHPFSKNVYTTILDWMMIVTAFTMLIAVQSTISMHFTKIKRKSDDWQFSIIVLAALFITTFLGVFGGAYTPTNLLLKMFPNLTADSETPLMFLYIYLQAPMQATIFSLLAFYMASAAFRAFRARSIDATLLLVTASIVTLGRVPIGQFMYSNMPEVVEWILSYPNMAAQRGIQIGIQLGIIATSLKIILGIERRYLGGGQ